MGSRGNRNHAADKDYNAVWLQQQLNALRRKDWFGTLELKYEKGLVKRVILHESRVPPTR